MKNAAPVIFFCLFSFIVVGCTMFMVGKVEGRLELREEHRAEFDEHMTKLREAQEEGATCRSRLNWLFYGRCDVVPDRACEKVWGSFEVPSRAIGMHGIAPIECPQTAFVPWVNPGGEGEDDRDGWSFICAPPPGGRAP